MTRTTGTLAALALFIGALIFMPTFNARSDALLVQPVGDGAPGSSTGATITDAISGNPHISFLADGRPVITYADFDPAGPVFDDSGNRIPDPGGPQVRVLVCANPTCTGSPSSDVRIPLTATRAFGAVVDGVAVVAARTSSGPLLANCAATSCAGAVSLFNLAVGTDPDAAVLGLEAGPDGRVHVLLGTHDGPDPTTWITTCPTRRCDAPRSWELLSAPRALTLNSTGGPLAIGAQDAENLALINCLQPDCTDGGEYGTDLLGTAALVTAGPDDRPIVSYLGPDGARMVHCDDRLCTESEQAASILIEPTAGRQVTSLVDLDTTVAGAPLLTLSEVDTFGATTLRQIAVPQCAVPHCLGDGAFVELTLFAAHSSTVDTASSSDGTLHVVSDQLFAQAADGSPAYDEMTLMHASCGPACQCAISACTQHAPADVCGPMWESYGLGVEIGIDTGTVALIDLAIGGSPTAGRDLILGTPGNDSIVVDAGDVFCGGSGNDLITFGPPTAGFGEGSAFGGEGDDVIDLSALAAGSAWGGAGDDTIAGSGGADVLSGGAGDDRIWGRAGNDRIFGDAGIDKIRGGPGDDTIHGDADADDINGSGGDDVIFGGGGADTLRGGTGDDLLRGEAGDDILVSGNGGEDLIFGGDGDDLLLAGGPRPDVLSGGDGNDLLKGHGGADTLAGDAGDDEIRGGPQPDQIFGGVGVDDCYGGTQADSFEECESATE